MYRPEKPPDGKAFSEKYIKNDPLHYVTDHFFNP
jgi:hypothetical protein